MKAVDLLEKLEAIPFCTMCHLQALEFSHRTRAELGSARLESLDRRLERLRKKPKPSRRRR